MGRPAWAVGESKGKGGSRAWGPGHRRSGLACVWDRKVWEEEQLGREDEFGCGCIEILAGNASETRGHEPGARGRVSSAWRRARLVGENVDGEWKRPVR